MLMLLLLLVVLGRVLGSLGLPRPVIVLDGVDERGLGAGCLLLLLLWRGRGFEAKEASNGTGRARRLICPPPTRTTHETEEEHGELREKER